MRDLSRDALGNLPSGNPWLLLVNRVFSRSFSFNGIKDSLENWQLLSVTLNWRSARETFAH
jgi:hypothetical protein